MAEKPKKSAAKRKVSDPSGVRMADTKTLLRLLYQSTRRNYNRSFDPDDLATLNLANDGLHAVLPVMIHEHCGGVKVEPHLRCLVTADYYSATGKPRSLGLLDLDMEAVLALQPDAPGNTTEPR